LPDGAGNRIGRSVLVLNSAFSGTDVVRPENDIGLCVVVAVIVAAISRQHVPSSHSLAISVVKQFSVSGTFDIESKKRKGDRRTSITIVFAYCRGDMKEETFRVDVVVRQSRVAMSHPRRFSGKTEARLLPLTESQATFDSQQQRTFEDHVHQSCAVSVPGKRLQDLASGLRRGWSLPAQPCCKPSKGEQHPTIVARLSHTNRRAVPIFAACNTKGST
jgi:hypothetical protein